MLVLFTGVDGKDVGLKGECVEEVMQVNEDGEWAFVVCDGESVKVRGNTCRLVMASGNEYFVKGRVAAIVGSCSRQLRGEEG